MTQFLLSGSAVTGAARAVGKTSLAAGRATRTPEQTAGPADIRTRDAALPARTAAGPAVLAARAAYVPAATTATRVLLEDTVGGPCAGWGANGGVSGGHGHHGNRCSSSSTDNQRFHEIEFLEHGHRRRYTPFHTCPKH